ncbi:MAG TPA: hypothetical protein VF279_07775 [Acidimicrobiales bacterium]
MTAPDPHAVDPSDEGRHAASEDPLWNESHYLDFVSVDGRLAGYARIGLYPNLGVTWWTTVVVGPDRPLVASVAYDWPLPDRDLTIRGDGFSVHGDIDVPLDRLRLHGSAPARVLDGPEGVYRGEEGTPVSLGFDLTWSTDGVPYQYAVTTRYEIPCLVGGTVTVGDETLAIDGEGQRDHSWGVRDWWAFGWCWFAGRLDDGTRIHGADIRIPGSRLPLGYVQHTATGVATIEALDVTEELGPFGMPTSARARIDPGGLDLAIEPLAYGPLVLTASDGRVSRFPRAQVRFTATDGRRGTGWIEWNQPDPSMGGQ